MVIRTRTAMIAPPIEKGSIRPILCSAAQLCVAAQL
jgi:hypothetical protein